MRYRVPDTGKAAMADTDTTADAAEATQASDSSEQSSDAVNTSTESSDGDKPLGENGEKALKAEREARKALEKRLAETKSEMAPFMDLLKQIRGSAPDDEKTDVQKLSEQLEALKAEAQTERVGRLRLEVATTKGLTAEQAVRLQGSTKEELEADADALLALFPQTTPDAPKGPRGDPAQGARPGGSTGGIQSGAAKYKARKEQGPTY